MRGEGSLARRVAVVSVGAAILASAVAVAATTALALRAVARGEEAALVGSADLLASELSEDPSGEELADELSELQELGVRALVVRGDGPEGDADLPARPARGCVAVDGDRPWRVCAPSRALPEGMRAWVAAPDRVGTYRGPFLGAAGAALALALLLAAVGGGLAARWATTPLSRLRRALTAGDVDEPATVRLPPPSGVAEVDAVSRAIEALLARLDEELSRARRFASDAAHELRTPLTKILGELELLRESAPDGEPLALELDRLHARVTEMATLTERLLALARPASAAEGELASMAEIVESLVAELGSDRLELERPEDDALLRGDRALLSSLVRNGVDNALKFSTGPVGLRVLSRGEWVVVQIDDEGPGVPPAERGRVFEHFYREPSARGRAGHGLGLALVEHIARAHGGRAAFVDGAEGARLEIELPAFGAEGHQSAAGASST